MAWIRRTADATPTPTGQALAIMADDIRGAMAELKDVNGRLLEMMRTPRYKADFALLRTVPGVGAQTAMSILLECGDLTDFRSAEAFCAFVGLVPDMDRSDLHDGHCGMTRRRHRTLRYMFTECAWRAVRTDDRLSSLYSAYCRRMPPAKSIVKIANKLAKIIKFVLRNKKAYVKPI